MNDETTNDAAVSADVDVAAPQPDVPTEPVPPIESRFLFVDVAALRAKQLRRGAIPRVRDLEPRDLPHKLERVAMLEVEKGLIPYTVPDAGDGS